MLADSHYIEASADPGSVDCVQLQTRVRSRQAQARTMLV